MSKSNYSAAMKKISQSANIKEAILNSLDLPDGEHEVLHAKVLVAGYVEPEKTGGGIIKPIKSIEEGRFQGSIGLVIGLGPAAFEDTSHIKFHGKKLNLHDWVMYRASDGLELFINGVPCRLFEDASIQMRVLDPELYY